MCKMSQFATLVMLISVVLAGSALGQYVQTNLVSDGFIQAAHTDANLVNSWGLAHGPFGPWFVADNGTAVVTVYDGQGNALPPGNPLVIAAAPDTAAPSGAVFNDTFGFLISKGNHKAPAQFLFASEDGTVSGWNPFIDATHTIVVIDNSAGGNAVYKGLALARSKAHDGNSRNENQDNDGDLGLERSDHGGHNGTRLYLANFRAGVVEAYDSQFSPLFTFTDANVPAGYAPFGIRGLGDKLIVTFALQDDAKHDDVAGPGHGYVDLFDADGHLLKRLVSEGDLNSPWGLALSPHNFGMFGDALLIGNFGDGRINAFKLDGTPLGKLQDANGNDIVIAGLWGIDFGNGVLAGPRNALFFASGPDGENHGLFGKLTVAH